MIGSVKSEIAVVGSITSVKNAIAAAGRPIPRKPFTIPEIRKITRILAMTMGSRDGRKERPNSLFTTRYTYDC